MLYACGSNGRGQLGIGHYEDLDEFSAVPGVDGSVVEVAGGGNHTLVLLDDGVAMVSGSNDENQLGCDGPGTATFTRVSHPEGLRWTHVAAGWAFSVFVDEKNRLWTCGSGSKGELASETAKHGLEHVFTFESPVVAVKSAMAHTLVLLHSGQVYGWGGSRKGQLGVAQVKVTHPVVVGAEVRQISVGRDFSVLVPRSGKAIILGNFQGIIPETSSNLSVVSGWSSIAFVTEQIVVVGNGRHGQLDAPSIDKPDQVVAGSEHYLALKNQTISSWGWGEHGNCPQPISTDATSIFAGCATSYYVSDTSFQ